MMAPVYKVAVIQFDPKLIAVADNFATAEAYIRTAASRGAHLAVLPEFHLTSWAPEDGSWLSACAESTTYLAEYQALARELSINIVPGTICETHVVDGDDDDAQELRNMAYFLAAGSGDICGSYQKKNLWHPERAHLTSSGTTPHLAFDTPMMHGDGKTPVRAGLLVCWDLAFPEAFRELILDGAEIIIIPSWWYAEDASAEGMALNPDAEKMFLESATTLRAFENTAAVVFCNAGGMSCVAMPILGARGRMAMGEEGMEIVDVDLDVLRVAENNYKVRQDMRSEEWHYAHTRRESSL